MNLKMDLMSQNQGSHAAPALIHILIRHESHNKEHTPYSADKSRTPRLPSGRKNTERSAEEDR